MFINPYEKVVDTSGKWMKANFHTHAGTGAGTCGAYGIDEVISQYKEAGYDILTISNHDLFTDTEEYMKNHDLVLINGYEYSNDPHMLCIGNKTAVKGTHQHAVDACRSEGGFVILCHPNWQRKEYWPWKDIDKLSGFTGIEIFNSVIFTMTGSGLATDTWDYILSQGKLVWGFGNDDFHRWHHLGRVWNVIYSPTNNPNDIIEVLNNGGFYVSNGLVLNEFTFDGKCIRVIANLLDPLYITKSIYRFIGANGDVLSEQLGESGCYELTGKEKYVRVQVIGEHGAMLWTQPIYRFELFKRL